MPVASFGNVSVVEAVKPDEGTDLYYLVSRKELGKQVTTMHLNAVGVDAEPEHGYPGRSALSQNVDLAVTMWQQHSDKPPAWVESADRGLAAVLADHFGCPDKRPKGW